MFGSTLELEVKEMANPGEGNEGNTRTNRMSTASERSSRLAGSIKKKSMTSKLSSVSNSISRAFKKVPLREGEGGFNRSAEFTSSEEDLLSHSCEIDTVSQIAMGHCVAVLETLRETSHLTLQQDRALDELRRLSKGGRELTTQPPTQAKTPSAVPSRSSSSKARTAFLKRELTQVFQEVAAADDDDCRQSVLDVLQTYGGQSLAGNTRPRARKQRVPLKVNDLRHLRMADYRMTDVGSVKTLEEIEEIEPKMERRWSVRRGGLANIEPLDMTSSLRMHYDEVASTQVYCPPEWNNLTLEARTQLTQLLSVDNLAKWDFDVLAVARLTSKILIMRRTSSELLGPAQRCPLLFVGWAVLCSPAAQSAMEGSLGDSPLDLDEALNSNEHNKEEERKLRLMTVSIGGKEEESTSGEEEEGDDNDEDGSSTTGGGFSYNFCDYLDVPPEIVCNFLREVERRYVDDQTAPYHNALHAADVTRTLHCLLQFVGQKTLLAVYDPVRLFSILLAATFHDVCHPGSNNMFEEHTRSELAIRYNDVAILENMHASVGCSLLLGRKRQKEWDVYKDWEESDVATSRRVMIGGILGTDMSQHFRGMGDLAALNEKVRSTAPGEEKIGGGEAAGKRPVLSILEQALGSGGGTTAAVEATHRTDCATLADNILKWLLHSADISNPSKTRLQAVYWAEVALAEFFQQGDREAALGLPISPLCDRRTVKKPDSQIGFLKFVVRPTYVLLGELIPRVATEVVPIIDENIHYWTLEKQRLSMLQGSCGPSDALKRERPLKRESISESIPEKERGRSQENHCSARRHDEATEDEGNDTDIWPDDESIDLEDIARMPE